MRKNKLIELLQQIKGNPEIVFWNGFVDDYQPLSDKIVPCDLTKMTKEYFMKSCRLERYSDTDNPDYILSESEQKEFERYYKESYEYNTFVDAEDVSLGKYRKKRVFILQAKRKGKSMTDRCGTLEY